MLIARYLPFRSTSGINISALVSRQAFATRERLFQMRAREVEAGDMT
jgi:hypothetical protein